VIQQRYVAVRGDDVVGVKGSLEVVVSLWPTEEVE
jgi:hypothetical protein